MSREPMNPAPDDLYPADVKTPQERMEFLGRKLFAVTPEEMRKREAAWEQEQRAKGKQKSGPKSKADT